MIKELVRSAFRGMGLDIRRYSPTSSQSANMANMLGIHRIDTVLDVGANVGQYARDLRTLAGYRGRIVSFEPMAAAHADLLVAAHGDEAWTVAPRMALGAEVGSIRLNIAGNSESSSVLPMLSAHSAAAPESRYVNEEWVPLTTLDIAAQHFLHPASRVFLKVDTQGYEAQVLRGGSQVLSRTIGLRLELSLVELYAGQVLMPEMLEWTSSAGFELWAMTPAFTDSRSGRLLQIDATFFRPDPDIVAK